MSPSSFKDLKEVVWALDEPLADPAALPTLLLSREARKQVTVALTGEGADEIFGGYERYALALRGAGLAKIFPWLGRAANVALRLAGARGSDDSRLSRVLRAAAAGGPSPLNWSRAISMIAAIDDIDQSNGKELGGFSRNQPAVESERTRLLAVQLDDMDTALANGLLTKVDRMTMAASLEARCPFLDYRIVNLGLGLPDSWKIRQHQSKILLRRIAKRLLPPRIYMRPKHTFRVPLSDWLRGPLQSLALDVGSGGPLNEFGIVSKETANSIVQNHVSGRADFSKAIWVLFTLHVWLQEAARRTSLNHD